MVMARREVLVQLDDDLVEQLDALAAELGTNRSELMRRGAQAVLDAERLAAADQRTPSGVSPTAGRPCARPVGQETRRRNRPGVVAATTSTGPISDRPPVVGRSAC